MNLLEQERFDQGGRKVKEISLRRKKNEKQLVERIASVLLHTAKTMKQMRHRNHFDRSVESEADLLGTTEKPPRLQA
jgi:hypothetical protein